MLWVSFYLKIMITYNINFKKYTAEQLQNSLESIDDEKYPEAALSIYHCLLNHFGLTHNDDLYTKLDYEDNWLIDFFILYIPIIGDLLTTLIYDSNNIESNMYFKIKNLQKLSKDIIS
jgi:hypothetical protein